MAGFGRNIQETTGRPVQVSADGAPEWKHGGVTLDWSTVSAVSEETTLPDGTVVVVGDKYLRYGTVIDLIGTGEVQTIDLSDGDDPDGGTFTITYDGQTTDAIAYNASAQAVQDALTALSNLDPGDVSVGKSSFVYTLTFAGRLGNVPEVTADGTNLTDADGTVTVAVGTSSAGAGTGLYGPVNTGASDGRQAMARGETYILNETVVYSEPGSNHPPVLEGGRVFQDRLVVNGDTQPTLANLLTAMPRLRLVKENQ